MPPKKTKSTKQTQEQKIVTSTLLTISLKVDNYLYTREPIPLQKAKDFINEISKLKIECHDLRSRQVSEKLTTILKNVINEYPNEVTDSENSNNLILNTNVKETLNENFISKSDAALKIVSDTVEASVLTTNALQSPNNLIESVNMKDQRDINNNINICKDSQKEPMPVDRNKVASEIISHSTQPIVETCNKNSESNITIDNSIINKGNVNKHNETVTDQKSKAIKKKTPCISKNQMKSKTKSFNNTKNPKNNIKDLKTNKKTKSKAKQTVDLTWIENIKFVREINTEEHVVGNLKESFWSNLTMPANCSTVFETD